MKYMYLWEPVRFSCTSFAAEVRALNSRFPEYVES